MGWSHGIVNGVDVGYGVSDVCWHPECERPIDRGLAHACCEWPVNPDDVSWCEGFYCYAHLVYVKGVRVAACEACAELLEGDDDFVEPERFCLF